jgi:hypothetical protein
VPKKPDFLEQLHQCSVCGPARIFLTTKISYFLFSNLTHKTKNGTANGGRLQIATHLYQSNYLANQQQVLGFFEPFSSISKYHVQKCWVKTILLYQHVLTFLHPEFAAPLLLVLTGKLWSWEAKLSEGENTWLQIYRGRVEDVNIGGEKLRHREI